MTTKIWETLSRNPELLKNLFTSNDNPAWLSWEMRHFVGPELEEVLQIKDKDREIFVKKILGLFNTASPELKKLKQYWAKQRRTVKQSFEAMLSQAMAERDLVASLESGEENSNEDEEQGDHRQPLDMEVLRQETIPNEDDLTAAESNAALLDHSQQQLVSEQSQADDYKQQTGEQNEGKEAGSEEDDVAEQTSREDINSVQLRIETEAPVALKTPPPSPTQPKVITTILEQFREVHAAQDEKLSYSEGQFAPSHDPLGSLLNTAFSTPLDSGSGLKRRKPSSESPVNQIDILDTLLQANTVQ